MSKTRKKSSGTKKNTGDLHVVPRYYEQEPDGIEMLKVVKECHLDEDFGMPPELVARVLTWNSRCLKKLIYSDDWELDGKRTTQEERP